MGRTYLGWHIALIALALMAFNISGAAAQQTVVDEVTAKLSSPSLTAEDHARLTIELASAYLFVAPAKSREIAEEFINSNHLEQTANQSAAAYRLLGLSYQYEGDYTRDLEPLSAAYNFAHEAQDLDQQAEILRNMGAHYQYVADLPEALNHFLEAAELANEIDNQDILAKSYFSIANLYITILNFEEALEYLNRAKFIFTQREDKQGLAAIYGSYGWLHEKQGAYFSALPFYRQATDLFHQVGDLSGLSFSYINLGTMNLYENALGQARADLLKGLEYGETTGDSDFIVQANIRLGEVDIAEELFEDAEERFRSALAIAVATGARENEMRIRRHLSEIEARNGNFQEAMDQLTRHYAVRDDIYPLEYARSAAGVHAQYLNERREAEISQLRHAQTISELEAERANSRTSTSLGISILVLLLSLYFWGRYQTNKRATVRMSAYNKELIKLSKELEKANSIKSEFLANTSHEIRTPLNGILGMVALLRSTAMDNRDLDRLDAIEASSTKLLALVNDLLDLSKIEAGEITLIEEEFNLQDLIKSEFATWSEMARRKGLKFSVNIADEVPIRLKGISSRLMQILINLVGNAIKFTHDGQVRMEVYSEKIEGDTITVRMDVHDTGSGISDKDLERIFERFSQLDGSATREYGGSGLGLAICIELARLMNGEITVKSKVGEGSCFSLTLPLTIIEASTDNDEMKAKEMAQLNDNDAASMKILVAEDNEINQAVLKGMMEHLGYEIELAANGKEVVEIVRRDPPDLILMDIQMPVIDGETAMKIIREADEPYSNIPIVAVTANAMVGDREKYLECGMDDYLAKPIDIKLLSELLHRMSARVKEQKSL